MKKKRVGIWIRVSTGRQAQGDSPKIHERRARAYAEAKGWEVFTVYHLEGISGKTVSSKEETKRMLEDIEQGNIDILIFSKLARFARNTKELLEFADIFKKYDAALVSLQESIDTSTAAGRLFYTILGAMAQWEREETVERIRASNKTRRSLGKMAGGMASYGYTIIDARLQRDEKEAPIRKLMYELFLEHKRCATVARILNERGYTTRKGKAFSGTAIKRLLINSDAKGIHVSNTRGVATQENPTGEKPKDEWVYTECPVIVSKELWNDVNAILDHQQSNNKNARPLNQRVNLFTGYLYCDKGHKMYVQSKAKSYSCKECKLRLEKNDLETIFKTRLKSFVNSKEEKQSYFNTKEEIIQNKRNEIKATQDTMLENEKKMNQLLTLHLENKIPTKGFETHYNPLFEQNESLEQTQATLEKELQKLIYMTKNFELVSQSAVNLYDTWDSLRHAEKRSIIESVVKAIHFNGQEIIFKLRQMSNTFANKSNPNGSHSHIKLLLGVKRQS